MSLNKYGKAIISLVMSVIFALNTFLDMQIGVDANTITAVVNGVIAVLTPILVYFVPNTE